MSIERCRCWLRHDESIQGTIKVANRSPSPDDDDQSDQRNDEEDGVVGVHGLDFSSGYLLLLSRFEDGEAGLDQLSML